MVHILPWLKLPVGRQERNKSKQSKSAARTTSSRQSTISLEREDHDVVDAEEFLAVERTDKKACVLASSGRPSVKRNAVNGKYGTNYRNSTVTKTIMGKTVTLGRACALVGVALMGPNIPIEEAGHEERLHIFKSAAYYALTV